MFMKVITHNVGVDFINTDRVKRFHKVETDVWDIEFADGSGIRAEISDQEVLRLASDD